MTKRILSVSYDEPLLRTREMLLERQGHDVTSAFGFTAALQHCKKGTFDLFILGHSIPEADKAELIKVFRANCDAPVLALSRLGENAPDGADAHVYPDDIQALLDTVDRTLSTETSRKSKQTGSA